MINCAQSILSKYGENLLEIVKIFAVLACINKNLEQWVMQDLLQQTIKNL